MEQVDERRRTEVFARLRELIAIGRRYDMFTQKDPRRGAAQIAELNAPGLRENAWDRQWAPGMLRAKVARVSSAVTLEPCRPPGDPEHDPALMDVLMPAAIVAACVVAHEYGVAAELPTRPLRGYLDVFSRLLRRVTVEQPGELEAIAP